MEAVTLLVTGDVSRPALETVYRLETELLARSGWVAVVNTLPPGKNESIAAIVRALGLRNVAWSVLTLGLKLRRLATPVCANSGTPRDDVFVFLMDAKTVGVHSASLLGSSGRKAAMVFDAWPSTHAFLVEMFHTYGFDHLFVTARDSAAALAERLPPGGCSWLPEGLARADFRARPIAERDIAVMQFGRRYDRYHDLIVKKCEAAGISYLFERRAGEIIFPTAEDFLEGLSRTRISVCFPRAITHPEIAGGISTMTQRYLGSMMSKCLVLGAAPDELEDLFPYRPVVEVDFNDPFGQLQEILNNFASHQDLIERNYRFVVENHLSANRIAAIEGFFRGAGGR